MKWQVKFTKHTQKQISKLPQKVQNTLELLVEDIKEGGPVQGRWPNYSKLSKTKHHCHLKKGKPPTYVAAWKEIGENQEKMVLVSYVGTHEKAPY